MYEVKTVIEKDKDLRMETSKRVSKLYKEFAEMPVVKLFSNSHKYDEMIAQVGIPVSALCEHHGVSFEGEVHVAYIPDKWLTGLSKIGRVVEYYLNPTVMTTQEKATHLIAKHLIKALNPKGLMVIIKAKHNCICFRGVKKPSWTITSQVYKSFKMNKVKDEFLQLIKL